VGQYKVIVSDLKSERERLLQFFQTMSVVIKEAGIEVVRAFFVCFLMWLICFCSLTNPSMWKCQLSKHPDESL
jgi:hypothetical protein